MIVLFFFTFSGCVWEQTGKCEIEANNDSANKAQVSRPAQFEWAFLWSAPATMSTWPGPSGPWCKCQHNYCRSRNNDLCREREQRSRGNAPFTASFCFFDVSSYLSSSWVHVSWPKKETCIFLDSKSAKNCAFCLQGLSIAAFKIRNDGLFLLCGTLHACAVI